jgi:hypothetical protein
MIREFGSFNGFKCLANLNGFRAWERKDETVNFVIKSRPRIRKAQARIVQGNPILGIRFETMSGKITPPKDEPAIFKPPAMARLLRKDVIGCTQYVSV